MFKMFSWVDNALFVLPPFVMLCIFPLIYSNLTDAERSYDTALARTGEHPIAGKAAIGSNVDVPNAPVQAQVNGNDKSFLHITPASAPKVISDLTPSYFLPKVDFGTGMLPYSVAVGDLDGDGKPEMATANYNSNTISVLRNISTTGTIDPSSFAAKVDFATGANPCSVLIRDIDGDGKRDLIVVNFGSGSVSVLQNISTGTIDPSSFAARVDFATGNNPYGLTVGELNGDGKPEIIVTNTASNTVSLLRNTSVAGSINAASFAAKLDLQTGSYPIAVAIADLDGTKINGITNNDLLVVNQNSNTITAWPNVNFSGDLLSFSGGTSFATGDKPVSIAVANINREGGPEVIVANSASNNISVFINTLSIFSGPYGPGLFRNRGDYATPVQPVFVDTGDVDKDRIVDIICANAGGKSFSVFPNTSNFGGTSFAPRIDFPTESSPFSLAFRDLDGDGIQEMITSNATHTVSVFKVNQQPQSPVIYAVTPNTVKTEDQGGLVTISGFNFNGEREKNIVYFGAVRASVSGVTAFNISVRVPAGATYQPVSVLNTATGLTGYSSQPFLPSFTNPSSLNINSKYLKQRINFTTGTLPYAIATGDLDGDGKVDLVVVNANDNTVSVLFNTASPGNIDAASMMGKVDFATGTAPKSVTVLDMDNDGKLDIVVVNADNNAATGSNTVSVLRNRAVSGAITPASFEPHVDFTAGSFATPYNMAVGDMNRDGKPDIIVANLLKGTLGILGNASTPGSINSSSFSPMQEFGAGMYPRYLAVGDLDGDNMPDIAVANEKSNNVSVLRNTTLPGSSGGFSFAGKVDFPTGLSPNCVAVGDMDGDGKPDLAVVNYGSNSISVLRNTASSGSLDGSSFSSKVDFPVGNNPFCIALGDLNGDAKIDFAVASAGSNSISVLRNASEAGSINVSSFASKVDFDAGGYPVFVTIADLDLDGVGEIVSASAALNSVSVLKRAQISPPVVNYYPFFYYPTGGTGTISGDYFNAIAERNIVYFGAVKAQVKQATSSSVQVVVPAGATYQPVSVLNTENGLIGYSINPFSTFFTNPFGPNAGITPNFYLPKVDFATGGLSRSIAIGDIDGDGKPELVVANESNNSISVMRNLSVTGNLDPTSFAAKVDFSTGAGPFCVVISDVDADGKLDVVVANSNSCTLSVLRNTSVTGTIDASSLAPRVDFALADHGYPLSVAVGDLDVDGKPELVAANALNNTVTVLYNTSVPGTIDAGSFAARTEFATGNYPRAVAVGDVSGDRRPDIVVVNQKDNTVSVLQNLKNDFGTPPVAFSPKIDYPVQADPNSVALADMDGNSNSTGTYQLDIVTGNYGSNSVNVLLNRYPGTGLFTASSFTSGDTYSPSVQEPYFIAVGDADGDSKPDIVSANAGSNTVSIIRNEKSNFVTYLSFSGPTYFATGGYPVAAAIGDLNGDGIAEVVTANASGSVSVFKISSPQSATIASSQPAIGSALKETASSAGGKMQLYPNPTQGEFTLQLLLNGPAANLEVINENGTVVQKKIVNSEGKATTYTIRLSLRSQPAGIYYVKVTSVHGVELAKIIVQR